MPPLLNDTTVSEPTTLAPLMQMAQEPFPRTPEQMLAYEQRLAREAGRAADQVLAQHLRSAHADAAFVEASIAAARARSPVPLLHKGLATTCVLLLGGTRVLLATPYLRQDLRSRKGPARRKRHASGSGCYPVLEALGISDRVSPATRSEIALHIVQSASYSEAASMLERRGLTPRVEALARCATSTATTSVALRDAAVAAALDQRVPSDGALAGKRVRVSTDGGRVRTRVNKRGRKTKRGRHRYHRPWREPRVLVIDILDEEGKPDRLRLPLYDTIIAHADAVAALIIGYLRLLGAAEATIVEFIADGAPWIWARVDAIREGAEIAPERFVEVLDFYHAAQHLAKTVELCKSMSTREREALFERLRHALRHAPDGVEQILTELGALGVTRRGKVMKKALAFFDEHAQRMRYPAFDTQKLPVGSGQVESAVRRVINLRFKAPGTFWDEACVDGLMHLRAAFKSGRWEEVMRGVITGQFQMPCFDPVTPAAAESRAEVEAEELFNALLSDDLDPLTLVDEVAA